MNIAIDYDDTYTLNPRMWDEFIQRAYEYDCEVYLVTWRDGENRSMRDEVEKDLRYVLREGFIHFTNLKAKRKYMEDQGIYIDVWIDDNPYAILHDGDITYMQQRKIEKEKNVSN